MRVVMCLAVTFTVLLGCHSFAAAGDISDAAFRGNLAEVKKFVQSGADVNFVDENESRPLINAVDDQNYEIVSFLLSKGADVDATDSYGTTALMKTCEGPVFEENAVQFLKIAKLLIEHGANVNAKNGDGVSVLKYCIDYDNDDEDHLNKNLIKLLKAKGAH